ncbi:MAG: hypothetical protein ABIN48_11015 [Ginsengibacter sp.]
MAKNKLPISFRLVKMEEKQFSTFDIPDVDVGKITQKVAFGFGADPEKRVIVCGCHYTLLVDEQPFINIHLLCFFAIEEKAWNEKLIKPGEILLDRDFAIHLASITASTTRGALFANTKNTIHQKYPMALIDTTNSIKEDISILI